MNCNWGVPSLKIELFIIIKHIINLQIIYITLASQVKVADSPPVTSSEKVPVNGAK